MTRRAFAFIGAGLFVYLVAGQTQVGWLYLFDAIIWSLLVLSGILPGYSLKSLRVQQQVVLPPSGLNDLPLNGPLEDETIQVRLKVGNGGRFARHFIKLVADCPFEQPESRRKTFLLTTLSAGSPAVFSYPATCYHRGFYASSNITLESGGLLGLFVRRRSFQLPLNLTIYPGYYHMPDLPVAGEEWLDWGSGVKSSSASEFYGSRNYQFGEPLKYIHWRNTARVGHFMIKEFERAGQGSLVVALDTSRDLGSGRETTLEYSIKIAASLAALCARSGRNLDLIAGRIALHNADWQTTMDCLTRLAVTEKAVPSLRTATSGTGQSVVVVVPAVITGQTPALAQLAGRGRGLAVILEDFVAEEATDNVASSFSRTNLEVVRCSRGKLEGTINRLGASLFLARELPGGVR